MVVVTGEEGKGAAEEDGRVVSGSDCGLRECKGLAGID